MKSIAIFQDENDEWNTVEIEVRPVDTITDGVDTLIGMGFASGQVRGDTLSLFSPQSIRTRGRGWCIDRARQAAVARAATRVLNGF